MTLSVQILLSLLTLFAGMLLLAKTKKDSLGRFFSFISWFIIVISLGLFISYMSRGICKCKVFNKSSCDKYVKNEKCCMPGNCYMMCCEHNKGMGMCCKEKQKMCCEQNKDKMCGKQKDITAMTPEQRAENVVTMLTEKLKLTTEQVPKVKEIFLSSILSIDKQMKDADDMEGCRKQCEKIRNDKLDALKKVLTPEQFKNLPDWCTKTHMIE